MYYYIVDPQKISQKEFERVQSLLYSSLSEYRVAGEVVRVTGLRTINQLVENALARGAKTIVAVGHDDTLHDVINAVRGREIILGFIPLAESEIGNILGIKSIEQGAKTVGLRRIQELDLGMVNQNYFLSKLSFGLGGSKFSQLVNLPTFKIKFAADGQYEAELPVVGGSIVNMRWDSNRERKIFNPTDGIFDVMLLPKLSKWQTFKARKRITTGQYETIGGSALLHARKIEILSPQGLPVKIGDRVVGKTPTTIEILPKAIKLIVGRDRTF